VLILLFPSWSPGSICWNITHRGFQGWGSSYLAGCRSGGGMRVKPQKLTNMRDLNAKKCCWM